MYFIHHDIYNKYYYFTLSPMMTAMFRAISDLCPSIKYISHKQTADVDNTTADMIYISIIMTHIEFCIRPLRYIDNCSSIDI